MGYYANIVDADIKLNNVTANELFHRCVDAGLVRDAFIEKINKSNDYLGAVNDILEPFQFSADDSGYVHEKSDWWEEVKNPSRFSKSNLFDDGSYIQWEGEDFENFAYYWIDGNIKYEGADTLWHGDELHIVYNGRNEPVGVFRTKLGAETYLKGTLNNIGHCKETKYVGELYDLRECV